jgi:hypothetical protein
MIDGLKSSKGYYIGKVRSESNGVYKIEFFDTVTGQDKVVKGINERYIKPFKYDDLLDDAVKLLADDVLEPTSGRAGETTAESDPKPFPPPPPVSLDGQVKLGRNVFMDELDGKKLKVPIPGKVVSVTFGKFTVAYLDEDGSVQFKNNLKKSQLRVADMDFDIDRLLQTGPGAALKMKLSQAPTSDYILLSQLPEAPRSQSIFPQPAAYDFDAWLDKL